VLFLASHQEDMLRSFCNKGIVLRSGKVEFIGAIDEAIVHYNGGCYQDAASPHQVYFANAAA